MGLGGIAAHDQNEISVLDVVPRVRHRAASECGAKTGHRRTVSNSRLVFERQYPGRSDELVGEVARLVAERGAAEEAGAEPAIDRDAIAVLGDEVLVAVFFHQLGDALDRELPGDALELV